MNIHGLTGGIGCGKTTVARMLERLGVPVLDADRFARQVVEPGTEGLREIVAAFGPQILREDGALARDRLGAIVFADPAARRRLEEITHPRVRLAMAEAAQALSQEPVVFMDVPLLYEARDPKDFRSVAVVWAPPDVQRARVMARDGVSAAQAQARIEAQIPIDDKARRADWVIDNSQDEAYTATQVRWLVDRLREDVRRGR